MSFVGALSIISAVNVCRHVQLTSGWVRAGLSETRLVAQLCPSKSSESDRILSLEKRSTGVFGPDTSVIVDDGRHDSESTYVCGYYAHGLANAWGLLTLCLLPPLTPPPLPSLWAAPARCARVPHSRPRRCAPSRDPPYLRIALVFSVFLVHSAHHPTHCSCYDDIEGDLYVFLFANVSGSGSGCVQTKEHCLGLGASACNCPCREGVNGNQHLGAITQ